MPTLLVGFVNAKFSIFALCRVFIFGLTVIVTAVTPLLAYASEDVVIPEDKERRLPKQTVTAGRGGGNTAGINSILSIVTGGNFSDLASLGLHGEAYILAVACNRNPDSFACRELACEVAPKSKECEQRLDTIVVIGERPKPVDYTGIFNVSVEFSPLWFNDIFEESELDKEEERRKELEKQCQNAYKEIFTDLAEFNFGFTFGSAVGGVKGPVDGRAANISALKGVMRKLIQLTKPIMTTGVNGIKPVARYKGQEAVNGTYLNVRNNNLTRGTHVSMAEQFDGTGVREFHLDDQYKHTISGGVKK